MTALLRGRSGRRFAIAAFAVGLALCSAARADTSVNYSYDALGRVIQVTYPNGAVITYAYDAAGNRILLSTTGVPVVVLPLLGGFVIPIH